MKPDITDRLPPHSPEAEQGVLGCVFLSPKECLGECIEKLKEGSVVFYDIRHMTIYDACVSMYDNGQAVDIITLQQRLKDDDMLEQCGGINYLTAISDAVPSAANLSYYLDIIQEKYLLRRMLQTSAKVTAGIYDYEGNPEQLLGEVERDFLKLTQDKNATGLKDVKQLLSDATVEMEGYQQRQGILAGLATGFPDLDKLTSGLQPSDMIVIAARPSMGKTSLALNIADSVAVDNKNGVGIFSLEMTARSLIIRMICSRSRVNIMNVRDGRLIDREFPMMTSAITKLASSPLYIDDSGSLTLLQLRTKARRMSQRFSIKLFIVDYLQLLRMSGKRESRQQEVADISYGIKSLAKELNVPIIVLCQLNRDIERDNGRKPRLSDLRESGAIEQDADIVAMLHKPKLKDEDDDDGNDQYADAIPINLLLAKNRNGGTGDVNLTFLKAFTRFVSAAPVSYSDIPELPRAYND